MVAPIFGPNAAQHRANVKKRVESCALARARSRRTRRGRRRANGDEGRVRAGHRDGEGFNVRRLLVMDPQAGVPHERRMLLNT